MKKLTLLIALGTMLMTACVTRNPTKAKKQIAEMVELNPSISEFQSDTLIKTTTRRTVINVPGDIRNRDVKEKVDSQLTGLSDKEKKKVFKRIRKAQKYGTESSTRIGDKLLNVEGTAEGGVQTTIETPVKGLVVNKYTVQPPKEEVKKKDIGFWDISKIGYGLLLLIILFFVYRFARNLTNK